MSRTTVMLVYTLNPVGMCGADLFWHVSWMLDWIGILGIWMAGRNFGSVMIL